MRTFDLRRSGILLTAISSFFLFSCKKDIRSATGVTAGKLKDGIPTYYFHWETANVMPTPSGAPTIYVPWGNLAVRGFTTDILYDYQPNDGWELVYNEFDPTMSLPSNPVFVLYNRFRGILRIYIYVTTNGFQVSDYLTSGITLSPDVKNSNMLNYIGQDLIDVNTKRTVFTKIEPSQIATGTWYATQYEIAYDPAIAGSSYSDIGMNWTLKWTNITNVSLGGDIVGKLTGTISTPASGFSLSGTASQAAIGGLDALGLAVFQNNAGSDNAHPGTGNKLGLPANIFEAAQSGLSSGLSGVVKNIFGGIFGSSGSTQTVDLTLNATITLTGSETASGALIPDPGLGLGVPGTLNSQSAPGFNPHYDAPLGVFYISGRPKISVVDALPPTGVNLGYGATERVDKHSYSIDNSSFQTLFNQAVINSASTGAHIENFKEEMVLFVPTGATAWYSGGAGNPNEDGLPAAPGNTGLIDEQADGAIEQVGSYSVVTNPTYSLKAVAVPPPPFAYTSYKTDHSRMAVRFSFYVVSNSNSAIRNLIVKTFWADQVYQ